MYKKIWTLEDDMKFRDMCLEGRSNIEIADEFNVTVKAVYHHRAKMHLTMTEVAALKAKEQRVTEKAERKQKRGKEIEEVKLEIEELKAQVSTLIKELGELKEDVEYRTDMLVDTKVALITTEYAALMAYDETQYIIATHRPLRRLKAHIGEPVCIRELRDLVKKGRICSAEGDEYGLMNDEEAPV